MKIAIINLLPDSGHVIPLFKIAKVLIANNIEVKYFGPSETQQLANDYNIDSEFIGAVRPENHQAALARLCKSSPFVRQVIAGKLFFINYGEKVAYNGLQKVDALKLRLFAYAPDLIISDDHHLFTKAYKMLAKELNLSLILNDAMGSGFNQQNAFLRQEENFGFIRNKLLGPLKKIFGKGYALIMRLFFPISFKHNAVIHQYIATYVNACTRANIDGVKTLNLSLGIGALERKHLTSKIFINPQVVQLGPLPIIATCEITAELKSWLDDETLPPVIYIGFGTMIRGNFEFAPALISAAKKLGFRILWAHPQQPWKENTIPAEHIRWDEWGPQTKVLAHPRVKLFITHAGAGAIQEALWFAKPIICIPFLWDQPYNSWVVTELGCGVLANRSSITEKTIVNNILKALELQPRSEAIGNEFRKMESSNEILECIRNHTT